MIPEHNLLAAVIKEAIKDSKCEQGFRVGRTGDELKRTKQDAIDFLETNRLEEFIEFWHLGISASVIRRLAR